VGGRELPQRVVGLDKVLELSQVVAAYYSMVAEPAFELQHHNIGGY